MGFFDDLTKKASETYKNTAEKTNKLTREMKLKSLINDNKSKISKVYGDIGKKVYEKHIREENIDIKTELVEECAKIDAFAQEIEDMNIEMRALKGLRLCDKCGAEIMVNAKFCPKCGSKQDEITITQKFNQNTEATVNIVEEQNTADTQNVAEPENTADTQNVVISENTSDIEKTVDTINTEETTNTDNTEN